MKHKVFILRDNVEVKWERNDSEATMNIVHRGNLEDLNTLLDSGWLITETIILELSDVGINGGIIQNILYNLEQPNKSSSRKA